MKLNILYGTQFGSAEILAEDFQTELAGRFDCSVAALDTVTPQQLSSEDLHLLLCSTTGSGELPDNAEGFWKTLQTDKPDLSHIRFAIFGLGDRTYADTFNQGSEQLMVAMEACGAKRIGERGLFDSSDGDMPEDIAFPWFENLPLPVTT
ncbi:flavodoxin domain-containing protein [Phaeobacter sp.]|uniref:flavodoxin domain-containing protein n=1 Tax=Phaeobacter sp. TaxID=1902409 RepID=UPI0025EB2276|nr:flavodoxin domain-containing protein [Phaeobacter sp.]